MEHAAEIPKSTEGRRVRRRSEASADSARPSHLLQSVQQQAGNQAMQQLLRTEMHRGAIQAKLSISQPGDPAEREADAAADHVMRSHAGVEAAACSCSAEEGGVCDACRQKAGVMRKTSGGGGGSGPGHSAGGRSKVLDAVRRSPGHPLDAATRAFFEPRFGRDFSGVRIHTGAEAAESARAIDAHAYTAGEHMVFASGQFAPETDSGRRLLAHELVHVVQQEDGTSATIHRDLDPSLNVTMTPEYARGLSDEELARQDAALADYLSELDDEASLDYLDTGRVPNDPEWDAAAENLKVLRNEKDRRAAEAAGAGQVSQLQQIQVQVLTPEQYMAMTGRSPDELPEGQYVSSAATVTGMGMTTSTLLGIPNAGGVGMGPSLAPSAPFGPIDVSNPAGRVVAFGISRSSGVPSYMDVAEGNTGLNAINIQDMRTWERSGLLPGMPYFPEGPQMESVFKNSARGPGGLDPMFSGVLTQEALEGNAASTVHFDMRGVDLTPTLPPKPPGIAFAPESMPGFSFSDFHSSSEARQVIAYLASTNPGERNVTVYIQHEDGVSVITPDSNTVQGDPLPPRLAERVPNIANTPDMAGAIGEGVEAEGLLPVGVRVPPTGVGYIRAGGAILMIYGAYESIKRIEEATPEERPIVEAEEAGSWTGGLIGNFIGSAIGGAVVCSETGPGAFLCALGFGIAGAITGSVIGRDVAHNLAESMRMTPAEFANTATLMFGTPEEKRSMCELKEIYDPDSYDPLCDGL